MRSLYVRLFMLGTLAALTFAACDQSTPLQPEHAGVTPQRTTANSLLRSVANPPDFTGRFTDIVPGQVISVTAYRIDATTWWVSIEVLDCDGDFCRNIWIEYIYMGSPFDPGFEAAIREALDTDHDGIWNWQEKIHINYQQ